jgi:hypothetical protein
MTREQEAELVNACNDGITGRYVSPVLTRLRTAWLEAHDREREIFKAEILSHPNPRRHEQEKGQPFWGFEVGLISVRGVLN